MTEQTLPLPNSAASGLNTSVEVGRMHWESSMQPGVGTGGVEDGMGT